MSSKKRRPAPRPRDEAPSSEGEPDAERESRDEAPRDEASRDAEPEAAERHPARREAEAPQQTTVGTKLGAAVGVAAAVVLLVLVNVLAARHYKRWDFTTGGLYTLTEPTKETLRSLEEPIVVYVLLAPGDPLAISLRHLLDAYRSESARVEVKVVDPDTKPAEFLAVQQRFGVVAGKTDDGRVLTDVQVIVARGDKPYYLTSRDLVQVEDSDDMRTRPRLEEALTGAMRSLLARERARVCFTSGHGEASLEEGGENGLAALRDRLSKNNYEALELPAKKTLGPGEKDPLPSCSLLVVARPTERVPEDDVARMVKFVEGGGSALVVAGPVPDEIKKTYVSLGLERLLALAGVKLEEDFVFERDPSRRPPQSLGEIMAPSLEPHPITEGLLRAKGVESVLRIASSLTLLRTAGVTTTPILKTSKDAFGIVDFFAWAASPGEPKASPGDHLGPLVLAVAAEREKAPGSGAERGARMVVIASPSPLLGINFQREDLTGTRVLVESSITWLASRPAMLELPKKPTQRAGLRISEEGLAEIFRYVVVYMPLATILFGVAVYLRRRGERRVAAAPKGAS
jgi:hypothetical protein